MSRLVRSWDDLGEDPLYEIERHWSYDRRSDAEKMLYALRCGPVPYDEFLDEHNNYRMQPQFLWLFARRLVRRCDRFVEITDYGVEHVKEMSEKDDAYDEQIEFLESIDPDCLGWELD
ncbi:MAG: hypothetical protein ACREBA_00550 [Nitrosotalea sp.]